MNLKSFFLSRINEIISKYEVITIYWTHPRNTTANKIKLKLHASRALTWEHILTTLLSHIHKSVVLQYPDSVYMFVTGLDRFGGMMEWCVRHCQCLNIQINFEAFYVRIAHMPSSTIKDWKKDRNWGQYKSGSWGKKISKGLEWKDEKRKKKLKQNV